MDAVGGVGFWVGTGVGFGEAELLCRARGSLRLAVRDFDFNIAGVRLRD